VWWSPTIALFILYQTSLASIIRRAKWKALNEIQSQVEELRASNNLKDKETMEAINRLMDFHDRVKATRNSAIDSSTIINFINSLLLPLLAFLLGNFDKVLSFFSKQP
jgi:DNA-binding GntR family transcriptional regulator